MESARGTHETRKQILRQKASKLEYSPIVVNKFVTMWEDLDKFAFVSVFNSFEEIWEEFCNFADRA